MTTEVTGNCSYTPWPAGKGGPEALQKNLGRTLIGNVKWEWHTLDDWANAMESNGISINVAPQLGHSGLQISSGAVEDRPATPDELREMKRLAAEAMEMGAFSLSTGLSVAPSAYGTTDDIVELCASIRHYEGAFYATHARVGNGLHMSAINGGHRDRAAGRHTRAVLPPRHHRPARVRAGRDADGALRQGA